MVVNYGILIDLEFEIFKNLNFCEWLNIAFKKINNVPNNITIKNIQN